MQDDSVNAWSEQVRIPTYRIGAPNKNPMFLEKRIYQGSSGAVYPHPVIDQVFDEKSDQEYTALFLENHYLKIMILPQIGGRVQMALDKTNGYHFIYHNHVIKPALVGLTGPWISGGVEFNWPQHHRPSTFDALDWRIDTHPDGSATIWCAEIERMYGTKGMHGFSLYPDRAYLEISVQLYNRTAEPQTFLWWANPAVHVNDDYQSVFPPDVHAVMDHGKRDVSSFPIATGTYYKVDYAPGTDISRYKNIPVPTSYMAYHSDFDFVGCYDHGQRAGMMHVANHHVVPGKKQWTWGHSDFGQAWDRQLTDADGPYIELMCGAYTDNQPDFTWIQPGEEKRFSQIFMPYKLIGPATNASREAIVSLDVAGEIARIGVYVTRPRTVQVALLCAGTALYQRDIALAPDTALLDEVALPAGTRAQSLTLRVLDGSDELIAFTPLTEQTNPIPAPAQPAPRPDDVANVEELFLHGLHLEQYRHATYAPEPYYEAGLRRDPADSRCNNALGRLLYRRGRFAEAEPYFRRAIQRLTSRNPNPYDGEPFYNLGLSLRMQGRYREAFDAFYKAAWSAAWQDAAYFELARLAARAGRPEEAVELADRALTRNARHHQARHLKIALLRHLGRIPAARAAADESLALDRMEYGALWELRQLESLLPHPPTSPPPALRLSPTWGEEEPEIPHPPTPSPMPGEGEFPFSTAWERDLGDAGHPTATEHESPLSPAWERGLGGEGSATDRWDVPASLRAKMVEVARQFRKIPTPSEGILWQALRGKKIDGRKFRRQQPIGPFVVDFFCASERLIVEVDGPIHDSQQAADRQRQSLIESLGLRFVRVPASKVEHELPDVLQLIRSQFSRPAMLPQPPTSPPPALRLSPTWGEGERDLPATHGEEEQHLPLSLAWERGSGGEGSIELALDYAHAGLYADSATLLQAVGNDPLVSYTLGWVYSQAGDQPRALESFQHAAGLAPDYCFPNRLEDVLTLEAAIELNPQDARAPYYLGNFWYAHRCHDAAIACWEQARALDERFPTVHRNLGLAYYNKLHDPQRALASLESAFALDPSDARVLFEFDQLDKKLNRTPAERLARFEQYSDLVAQRDDLTIEQVTALNLLGRPAAAFQLLMGRTFHPWEGGEGKVTGQYVTSLIELAREHIRHSRYAEAIALLEQAQTYPPNLGEGKLYGAQENNIFYELGCAYAGQGADEQANAAFGRASTGLSDPTSAIFYNDQPPDMIFYQGLARQRLGQADAARAIFQRLVDYGRAHIDDQVQMDYFAVSLPDFLVFDEDLGLRNRIHCHYMIALGYTGLGDREQAEAHYDAALQLDASHLGATLHRRMLNESVGPGLSQ